MINAYRILSVDQMASSDEIDEAFEKAVASVREKYSGKPASLEASLDDLKEARRILLDENSRAALDKKLETDGNNQNETDQKEQILSAEQIAIELKGYTPSQLQAFMQHPKIRGLSTDADIVAGINALPRDEFYALYNGDKKIESSEPKNRIKKEINFLGFVSRNFFKLLITGAAIYAFFTLDALIPLRYDLGLISNAEKVRYEAHLAAKEKAARKKEQEARAREQAIYKRKLDEFRKYEKEHSFCKLKLVANTFGKKVITTRDVVRECGPIPVRP